VLGAEFDSYVREMMDQAGAPGVIIVVIEGDRIVYMKAHGTRVAGEDRPIDENTIVQIASHSKPFTAAALAMLVDEGRLSWDDPVKMHIPEFELQDPYVAEHVTIRDILSHQAGLPEEPGCDDPDFDFSALSAALSSAQLVTGFRDHFSYSGAGYAVAGEIISRVSGMSWEHFIQQRIFAPLSMESSFTSTPDMTNRLGPPDPDKNIFLPAVQDGDSIVRGDWEDLTCCVLYAPGGGILTTIADISNWMVFQLQNGEFGGERLISEAAIWEMRQPEVLTDLGRRLRYNPIGQTAAYGLGWYSFDYQGRMLYLHGGGWMRSLITIVPEEDLAVGVFTNANFIPGSILRHTLTMGVLQRALGGPDENWWELFKSSRN